MTVKKLLILCALITIAFMLVAWWQGELCHAQNLTAVSAKEIISLRKENVEVFDKGDGKQEARIYATPKYYKDKKDGIYKPLKDKFTSTIAGDQYILRVGDYYVTYIPLYVKDNIQITTKQTDTGVKQDIVLLNKLAPMRLEWTIETNAHFKDGGFTDRNGEFLFRLTLPTAFDADKKEIPIETTYYAMNEIGYSGNNIIYQLDTKTQWTYPITIDPTTTVMIGEDDNKTNDIWATNATYLTARNKTTGDGMGSGRTAVGQDAVYNVYRIAVTFQTNTIQDDAVISSAYVKMVNESEYGNTVFYLIQGLQDTTSAAANVTWFNDFTGWASSGNYTLTTIANSFDTDTIAPNDSLTFTLNAAGLALINKYGYTRFFIICEKDRIAEAAVGNNFITLVDDATYLSVTYTYTVPPSGASRSFLYANDKQYLYNADKVYLYQP